MLRALEFFKVGIIIVLIAGCSPVYQVASQRTQNLQIKSPENDLNVNAEVEALVAPFRAIFQDSIAKVIAKCDRDLYKARPESPLGNLLADALLDYLIEETELAADFAIINYGGIRLSSVPAGDLTVGTIFELLPFDDSLTVLELSGSVTEELFDHMAADGGWPISRGVSYRINSDKAEEVKIDGSALSSSSTYRVIMSNFLASGGGGCAFLTSSTEVDQDLPIVRDAVLKQLGKKGKSQILSATIENRVIRGGP